MISNNIDIILISILFFFAALALVYLTNYKSFTLKEKVEKKIFFAVILLGLLIRLFLAPITKGHSTDVLCFTYWADFVASKGFSNFYTSDIFVDYPPVYIYVLYIIGKLQHLFSIAINSNIMLFMIKLPSIISDIIVGYYIYRLGKDRLKGVGAIVLCSLYIFSPAVIINSAVWAQIDGFYTLFIVIMIYYIYNNKLNVASVIYTISALIKPQTFIFTPILLLSFVRSKNLRCIFQSLIYSVTTAMIIIFPFTGNQKLSWIIEKYKTTLGSYSYASVNAFNLFALTKGNWRTYTDSFLFLDYKSWGTIFLILITAFSAYIYFQGREKHRVFYISYFIISAVFVLSSKMHERYLFPALALAIILYIYSQERRILYSFIGFTITHYINVAYVLRLNYEDIYFVPNGSPWINIIAIANIVLLLFIVEIGLNMYCKESLHSYLCKYLKINKKDYYIIFTLTLVYFIIAIINLGSVKIPENYWSPSEKGEFVVADLGYVKELERLYYFPGLGGGKYKVYQSVDKITWQEVGAFNGDNIFVWNYIQISIRARYIKISCEDPGGNLNEVGIFEKGSNKPSYISDEVNSKIFDEQDTVRYNPSYLHGMYFDEIYHARTAFEHLKNITPYEWTHPPLGKIFIAIGIFLFGMNPFGWRIIGTLIGVIMIPLIYLFALKIFKKSKYAFIAAFLMAFDFMHFTQTRIATIDVYAVFFIILMYYFMYRFIEGDFFGNNIKKSLRYFILSGISFGMGAAAKWSCLYGGVGLAILLLSHLILKYKEFKRACRLIAEDGSEVSESFQQYMNIKKSFYTNLKKVIIHGVLFFIIVPSVIYLISYIPYMLVPRSKGLVDVLDYQKRMYEYHSTLEATHPFSSAWWEWPIIRKPIWYYSGEAYISGDKVSSIVSMGNPAIWWTGIITIIATAIISLKEKDKRGFYILIAAASQFIPWIFVPRLIFIYHYFATIPFVILSIVYVFEWLSLRYKKTWIFLSVYLFAVIGLFIMFYPIMSGFTVEKNYVEKFLRWFGSWYFYS